MTMATPHIEHRGPVPQYPSQGHAPVRPSHPLTIARNIQQSFLPARHSHAGGIDIAAKAVPALQVGGDFYDFIAMGEDELGLVIADVSGKGMAAALLMALSCALNRVISSEGIAAQEVMEKTNHLIYDYATEGYFVPAFYGILKLSSTLPILSIPLQIASSG